MVPVVVVLICKVLSKKKYLFEFCELERNVKISLNSGEISLMTLGIGKRIHWD
jgi:hypothetical protein